MRIFPLSFAVMLCFSFVHESGRAETAGHVELAKPECQDGLIEPQRNSVQRMTLPLVDERKQTLSLLSVIPDFDPERDVIVGMRDRKHTYLVNALIGRHDPGIFGGRGRFHENTSLRHLTVSPGLVVRLRLSAPTVIRIAEDMGRLRESRNLTCTNTAARILAQARVPGMTSFILTPAQMLKEFKAAEELNASYYLVNATAENLEDFQDQVKVLGPKKATTPPTEPNPPRQGSSSCNERDCSDSCMFASFDLDSCFGSCQLGRGPTSGSGCCEGSDCASEGSECGGSDSDCCN